MYSAQLVRVIQYGILFLLFAGGAASAAQVTGLYSASVDADTPVERRVENALAQVLVKVSGHRDIMQRPETQTLLDNASLLQQAQADERSIGFDPVGLKNLMSSLGLPVLPDDRPELLVWLAQDNGEVAELVESGGDIYGEIYLAMQQRGVPLRQPLLDLTDQLALTAQDLLSGDPSVLQQASARYQPDAILVGVRKGAALSWTLWWDGRQIREQSATEPPALHQVAHALADQVLGIRDLEQESSVQGTLVPEPVGAFQPDGITLEIEGVATSAAYLDLTGWIRRQPGVLQLYTAGQNGQRLTLIVQFEGGSGALGQLLAQNPQLMYETEGRYRWIGL
ncbi:hypothetical protein GCM10011352_14520 [Marinobacterium zhoushanense]|uniref:DUF2066 domain-containing protein n=1 Tax=Marinobacterium zhoushanense TaxID=1679163 RepID=A0ABQ1K741_9GAMM|nr:DUF2066 domain-containing protein [Marinobacterium zhoushanense]GGB89609.1 hypothetical protein GCM10011352_14520 [Marinobacterium zhoushanense]